MYLDEDSVMEIDEDTCLKLEDLKIVSYLGKGSYGKVYLAETPTGIVALKVWDKSVILEKNLIPSLKNEISIMESLNSPFIL